MNDKNYCLSFSITFFDENNNECEFKEESLRRIIFDSDTNIVDSDNLETKKLDSIIDIGKVGKELSKLLFNEGKCTNIDQNTICFDNNNFNIDTQGFLSAIFYFGNNETQYIMEYDVFKKRILYNYMIKNNDKYVRAKNQYGAVISFDNSESNDQFMNVAFPYAQGCVRFKKAVT